LANAHAVLASSSRLSSPTRRSVYLANAINSGPSARPAFANAHAVLASSYRLKSPTRPSASLANTVNNCASGRLAFANVHSEVGELWWVEVAATRIFFDVFLIFFLRKTRKPRT